jgi:hypothetical protein
MLYRVEILDTNDAVVDIVRTMIPFDDNGTVLQFDDYLSNYGQCRFRVKLKDPMASTDKFKPFQYRIRIKRANKTVWFGVITDNPQRTTKYIDIEARTLLWYFTRVQVSNDANSDYRSFTTGSMLTAVTTLFNEGKNRANSPMSDFTAGTIENPDYPWPPLSTTWAFSDVYKMEYTYANLFDVIFNMAAVANCDFEVTPAKVFNFYRDKGSIKENVSFQWGANGAIEDFNSPLYGSRMANKLTVIGYDKDYKFIKSDQQDTASITANKELWQIVAYNEVLAQDILNAKAIDELELRKYPDTELSITLNDKALPFGMYELGDYVWIKIKTGIININEPRRVVGWVVKINENDRETVRLITNKRKT